MVGKYLYNQRIEKNHFVIDLFFRKFGICRNDFL